MNRLAVILATPVLLAILCLIVYMMVVASNYEGRHESKLSNHYKAVPTNGCEHLYATDKSIEWFNCMGVEHVKPINNRKGP